MNESDWFLAWFHLVPAFDGERGGREEREERG